ncbi:MAG: dihydroorotate dehydrogenase electron transfer subunit [Candidatus Omnitrophica bacterium]|nr:dihydroorotate dehydrogenase electron transfer subunit [Candidatus Omnitrophota bacterium]
MAVAGQLKIRIESLKELHPQVYLLKFKSPLLAKAAAPGQFLHVKVDSEKTILRRPLSIHAIEDSTLRILFRVRGRGTQILSQYKKGDTLDIIGPLGNGFSLEGRRTKDEGRILVAGGLGVAPLVFLAQKISQTKDQKQKIKNLVLLGAKSKKEVLAENEFKKSGFEVRVATDDGSRGFKGTVTALLEKILLAQDLKSSSVHIYACGPKEMFSAIKQIIEPYPNAKCQVSFEQFMGCGLGICCGCVIETTKGYKKVCKDGPVFDIKEI